MNPDNTVPAGWRPALSALVESAPFQRAITILIVINAITLGLETWAGVMERWGGILGFVDTVILGIFVVEIALRIAAHGWRFFTNGWSLFDVFVVGIALMPSSGALSVLRALRILRAFRLVSAVPAMRSVIEALVRSVPGLSSIMLLLSLVFYVFAVMATKLYGASNPELFGSLGASMYSLFQVMTMEGWPDIVDAVLAHHGLAMLFFVPFMVLSTFTVLNLFIALIVDSMQKLHQVEIEVHDAEARAVEAADRARIGRELDALTVEIRGMRAAVERLQRVSQERG